MSKKGQGVVMSCVWRRVKMRIQNATMRMLVCAWGFISKPADGVQCDLSCGAEPSTRL